MRIYNTLHRGVEEFKPLEPGVARMYTCGPTVYRYAHIGNLRSYLMADWIKRILINQDMKVIHVKNITDVGHMRQEQLERGGDKVILAALAEGKSPQEIANYYTQAFHRDEAKLNILRADHFPRATDHVAEMLEVIGRLLDQDYAYQSERNIYFNVAKYTPYGQLSGNTADELLKGVRVEADPLKRDPRDFTLWKHAEPGRDMKWHSPWGEGFPGWHIECSAMSNRYLGVNQDIHTGGIDNIFPHHEDEIAQSEAAFGKHYVNYWVHGQHLLADGVKMAKSAGNEFTLEDLEARGFDPLAFRYLCLSVKYRNRLNFTFSALKAAQKALTRLKDRVWTWSSAPIAARRSDDQVSDWQRRFWEAVNNDLDLPKALALGWEVACSALNCRSKLSLLLEFDSILGLDLSKATAGQQLSPEVQSNLIDRESYRRRCQFERADNIRHYLGLQGYKLRDTREGPMARSKTTFELQEEKWPTVSSPREVASFIESPPIEEYSVVIPACNYLDDVQRCVNSVLKWCANSSPEVIVVDNGSNDGTAEWLERLRLTYCKVKVVHCDHQLGDAQAKNIGLKKSRGRIIMILDTSVELTDNPLSQIKNSLKDPAIGVVGPWGVLSEDLHHFHQEISSGEADAMQGYCFAMRRDLLREVGLMRECFRFYRNLDLDFSFQIRDHGYRVVADGDLPIVRHEHRQWSALGEEEREQLSRKNFGHFFKRWGQRKDMLTHPAS